jgi:phospholipid-translocating ATPase
MIISEVVTLGIYALSMVFLPEYFGAFGPTSATAPAPPTLYTPSHLLFFFCHPDLSFVVSVRFGWKVAVIVAVSALPLWIIKLIKSRVAPEATTKL